MRTGNVRGGLHKEMSNNGTLPHILVRGTAAENKVPASSRCGGGFPPPLHGNPALKHIMLGGDGSHFPAGRLCQVQSRFRGTQRCIAHASRTPSHPGLHPDILNCGCWLPSTSRYQPISEELSAADTESAICKSDDFVGTL